MLLILTVIVVSLLVIFAYKKGRANEDFFATWKIKYSKPAFLFGHSYGMMARKEHLYDYIKRVYEEFPEEKAIAVWDMRTPTVIVRDPKLLKFLTVKAFDHFTDHKPIIDEKTDPFFGNMLSVLKGQKWRNMRATLSPAFTGSKMRSMLQLITEVTEQLVTYLQLESGEGGSVREYDMKETCSRYTNDVIALCAFGIKVDSLKDRDNEFYTTGKALMDFSNLKMFVKFMVIRFLPKLTKLLKMSLVSLPTRKFFTDVILSTMEYREKNQVSRPDMVSLLMEAKKGTLKSVDEKVTEGFATVDDAEVQGQPTATRHQWTDEELIAQCFVFFIGGFENNSTVMTVAAYELAVNPDIQQKLFEEVKATSELLDGKSIPYETLHGMRYMDGVVCETLRKWPPAAFTDRLCTEKFDYSDPETGLEMHFEKGDQFWLPFYALHHDEKYFPEPAKFDPDRFSEQNRHTINQDAYMPFGLGPRVCPANRFVLMAVKAFLYQLVLNFEIVPVDKTVIPLTPKKDFSSIAKDIFLGLKRR